eukprot:CAMPEP_0183318716 /NCGR_PEP_ID=MMETSP0160_2-20130417/61490_1 /TAXON_ID=2839 ORGANISM="Odontella Sinensis, Strain Grunow 1884" /NCGR_SAMPLE_ID=MMETSP0160_2 /ASSEMBLY_ACC=CAM_ASM_000250 /LENGTH=68 /DNA_ID=CAMNT_0025485041 /DNA_START=333 /DNA_END=535 /DNA_ORIENTATION=+
MVLDGDAAFLLRDFSFFAAVAAAAAAAASFFLFSSSSSALLSLSASALTNLRILTFSASTACSPLALS